LLGSGDLLRSGARARVPNPGQPALDDSPGLAALEAALRLPLWPLWAGVAALAVRAAAPARSTVAPDAAGAPRAALAPAAAGAAWIGIVALMAEAGFSGEPRYAVPGAALIAISGAVGLALAARVIGESARSRRPAPALAARAIGERGRSSRAPALAARAIGEPGRSRRPAPALAAAVALVVLAAAPRVADLPALRSEQAYQWRLAGDLAEAVRAAGGREAVLACGRPYVGPLRGPLMAYRLGVAKHVVEPDDPPRAPGVVFRSALSAAASPAPPAPPRFAETARAGAWQVLASCGAAMTSGAATPAFANGGQ
ncbi:MAG TPA: hypothetical protein VK631_16790, partial [Solirubrobacteraceae bacterium]|nr:hypothetical protein [Solirubrobacteraceae bacterium]